MELKKYFYNLLILEFHMSTKIAQKIQKFPRCKHGILEKSLGMGELFKKTPCTNFAPVNIHFEVDDNIMLFFHIKK